MTEPKLVRDLIPDLMRAGGLEPQVRAVEGDEYRGYLLKKLLEDVAECNETPSIEKLASTLEVVHAIRLEYGFESEAMMEAQSRFRLSDQKPLASVQSGEVVRGYSPLILAAAAEAFVHAPSVDNLAKVLNAVDTVEIEYQFQSEQVFEAQSHKRETRGGFQKQLVLG